MKRACGTTTKDMQLVQKEDANAPFTSPPNSAFPGDRFLNSSPAVAAAKGGENPSAGAAKTSQPPPPGQVLARTGRPAPRETSPGAKSLQVLTRVSQAVLGEGRQQQESQQQRQQRRQRRRILGRGGRRTPHARAARGSPAGSAEPARPERAPAPPRRGPSFPRALGLRLLQSHEYASHIQAAASLRTAPGSPAFGAPVLTGHLQPWTERRAARLAGSCCRARAGLRGAGASPPQGPGPHGAAAGAGRGSHGACRRAPAYPGQRGWDGRRPEPPRLGRFSRTEGRGCESRGSAASRRARDPLCLRRLLPLRPALARSGSDSDSGSGLGSGSVSGSGSRAESVTAAQSGASLTKKARSHKSGRERRGRRARASPRGATARPPHPRAPAGPGQGGGPLVAVPAPRTSAQRGEGAGVPSSRFPTGPSAGRGEISRRGPLARKSHVKIVVVSVP